MGSEKLHWAGLAPACRTAYATRVRNVMGVPLPHVTMEVVPLRLPHSPAGISMAFEDVILRWTEVGQILGPWIQALGGISRVTRELEKTQRRVNALKHILIPQYRAAIERIRSILEEQERDSFIRAKRVKLSGGDQMGRLEILQ
jgi:V/A-type H+-transporting ATPase subunit D